MDKEGTNTWRYAQAGAKAIVAISPQEVAVIKKTEMTLENLDQITALLKNEDLDIIFIEGFHGLIGKRQDVLKIITAKDVAELEQTLEGTVQPILAIAGVVAQTQTSPTYKGTPIIKIPQEGQKLVDLIKKQLEQRKAKRN